MTVTITQEKAVNRPTPDRLLSTVLDHATVVDIRSFGLRNNEGLWPSYNCLDTLVPTAICPDPINGPTPKTFVFADWIPGFEFAVHGGVQCRALGLDLKDQETETARVFGLNEARGVEQALLGNRFVATTSDDPIQWAAPIDLTPAAAIDLRTALALLEGYAAKTYAGVPTIHMPRAAGELLSLHLTWDGNKAFTKMGSKVAFGGGYDEQDLSDGKWDLYATGEVYVERSERIDVSSYVVPGDGNGEGSDETGIPENSVLTLAERMYRVGVDCFVAKATGTVW